MSLSRQISDPCERQTGALSVQSPGFSTLLEDVPLLSSEPFSWEGLTVERYIHPPREDHLPPLGEHIVTLYLGAPLHSVQWLEDEIHENQTVRGDVMVKAAGRSHGWKRDKPADVLNMRLDPGFLEKVAEENGLDTDRVELLDDFGGSDPRVQHVGLALLAELEAGGSGGRVYGEALATALGAHLLRDYAAFPQAVQDVGGGLPKRALRAATDLVNDELSGDLSLSQMAGVANLSSYHFSRLFKQSTGLPPHQYVISRRVERAKALLASGSLPVYDVARAVGFAHQQHLTRHFKRLVGITPGRFREQASR